MQGASLVVAWRSRRGQIWTDVIGRGDGPMGEQSSPLSSRHPVTLETVLCATRLPPRHGDKYSPDTVRTLPQLWTPRGDKAPERVTPALRSSDDDRLFQEYIQLPLIITYLYQYFGTHLTNL